MGKTIPKSVTRDEMFAALRPFYELLGIDEFKVFDRPGITIGADDITFVIPAVSEEAWGEKRPRAQKTPNEFHPQRGQKDWAAEAMIAISVDIEKPDYEQAISRDNEVLREMNESLKELVNQQKLVSRSVAKGINKAASAAKAGQR